MTRMSRVRFGAGLLAIACLAVGVGLSGSASATPSAKVAKKAGKASCPKRAICLWSGHFSGGLTKYGCGNKPRGFSDEIPLDYPLNVRGGVSSYVNNGVREASLATVGSVSGTWVPLPRDSSGTSQNRLRGHDDQASALYVTC
jgi:hypothetical protein